MIAEKSGNFFSACLQCGQNCRCLSFSLSLIMEEEEIDFKVEAELVIEDIGFTVESISISKKLPSSRKCVYLNVLTKERKSLCVELSVLGFRVSTV